MTPVRYPDGTMGIPKEVIESVNRHKVGLKSPLMTPVSLGKKGFNKMLFMEQNYPNYRRAGAGVVPPS